MGRAHRKRSLHEALRPLGNAGLPRGWGEFWYGPGEGPSSNVASHPLLTRELLEEIASGGQRRGEIVAIFEQLKGSMQPENFSVDDPFIRALWEGQKQTLLEALRKMGGSLAVEMFYERESEVLQEWSRKLERDLRRLEQANNIEHSVWGIYQDLLRDPEKEDLKKRMISWGERDPQGLRDFMIKVFLPAAYDQVGRGVPEDIELLRASLRAIFSAPSNRERLWDIERKIDSIEQSGILDIPDIGKNFFWRVWFTGAIHSSPEDFDRRFYLNLDYACRSHPRNGIIHSDKRRRAFLESDLGKEIAEEFNLESESDIKKLAQSLSDEILERFLQGEIDLKGAFRLAAEEASLDLF